MAVSLIAGYTGGGIKLPCILNEGTITVAAGVYGPDGYKDDGATIGTPLYKDSFVEIDTDAANTFIATGGVAVVTALTAGSKIIGQIISEPKWSKVPTATQSVRATILTGGWYRTATVEFFGLSGVAKAVCVGADTGAIAPGTVGLLKIDDAASAALASAAAQGPICISVYDVASGGTGLISFHYVPKGTATVSVLIGFTGGFVVVT
jgi:hypothetical protein